MIRSGFADDHVLRRRIAGGGIVVVAGGGVDVAAQGDVAGGAGLFNVADDA